MSGTKLDVKYRRPTSDCYITLHKQISLNANFLTIAETYLEVWSDVFVRPKFEHNLSYPKQIARQLRTQFVERISWWPWNLRNLRATQDHWKRKYLTDHTHTRLTIRRWILSWPWNVGQKSLKVTEISAVRKIGCGCLFAFYSNYGRILSHFGYILHQRMTWPWVWGCSRSLKMARFDRPRTTFY